MFLRIYTPGLVMTLALAALAPSCLAEEPSLTAPSHSVGKDLQTYATVTLSEPAPAGDLQLTLTSNDPQRLLISQSPDAPGRGSLTLSVRARFRESPEFWLQALADAGEATYTVSAPGFRSATGTVAFSPSGFLLIGPHGDSGPPEFTTTRGGWPMKITVRPVRLDHLLRHTEPQYVRGGLPVHLQFEMSQPEVGVITPANLSISPSEDSVQAQFKPARAGKTAVTLKQPLSFRTPAALNCINVSVRAPGIAVADDMMVGKDLQLAAALSLGEPAPASGSTVKLTSGDPNKLLISASPTELGKASIQLQIPAGGVTTIYYLQALSDSGTVTHTAEAEGFQSRTGAIMLAPSGVILALQDHGPPDEAEVFRPESAGSKRNRFVALLSDPAPTKLVLYTAFLSPVTRRSADITVQPLRAGLNLDVELKNNDASIGAVDRSASIKGGEERSYATFKPARAGETVISVVTPKGFTEPSNATELLAIVRP